MKELTTTVSIPTFAGTPRKRRKKRGRVQGSHDNLSLLALVLAEDSVLTAEQLIDLLLKNR